MNPIEQQHTCVKVVNRTPCEGLPAPVRGRRSLWGRFAALNNSVGNPDHHGRGGVLMLRWQIGPRQID
jgi:hypothetical protein